MHLRLENINKVANADVCLNGLTVIAGVNSSGKSTIGKMLFSIVKAKANSRESGRDNKGATLEKHLRTLYKRLNGKFTRQDNPIWDSLFPLPMRQLKERLLQLEDEELDELLHERRTAIAKMNLTPRMTSLMMQDLENIEICLASTDNSAADLAAEMRYFVESEFMNKICSLGTEKSSVFLEMEDEMENVSIEFKNDNVDSVRTKADIDLKDATYVESPLYLHMLECLLSAETFRELGNRRRSSQRMIPIHIKDLAEKVDAKRIVGDKVKTFMSDNLMSLTGGHFKFDSKTRRLVFEKNGVSFSPINVASGIKSFGLIQMLLETNVISDNKILIWDEPENHLHPEWQVEFASILVQLAKSGIPVVVSTHSPYFVQGIRYFSAKYDLESFVNYYLAEERPDGLSDIREVTNTLNDLFLKLSAPLNAIMNVDAVRIKQEE